MKVIAYPGKKKTRFAAVKDKWPGHSPPYHIPKSGPIVGIITEYSVVQTGLSEAAAKKLVEI